VKSSAATAIEVEVVVLLVVKLMSPPYAAVRTCVALGERDVVLNAAEPPASGDVHSKVMPK